MKTGGFFVISLDFELHWGMFDKTTIDAYGEHYKGVQKVVPELLDFFAEHNIHATWATVGMLMCESKTELLSLIPKESLQPRYKNSAQSAYKHIASRHIGENEKDDPNHFAPSLVDEIIHTPGQELASHTFSHYYAQDGARNAPAIFKEDLRLQKHVSEKFGVTPTSIVFPRNQSTVAALELAYESGMTAYRGNEDHFLYRNGTEQPLYVRALRLLDAYINISGHHTTPLKPAEDHGLVNIPSSRFLRPYSKKLRFLEPRRLRRITDSMTHAAEHGEIFHLWWHPHNFGTGRKENMENLRTIIEHFKTLEKKYGMQSATMRELAETASHTTAN